MTDLTIHSCIKARGKAKGCPKCPIMLKGFCPSLIDFILRAENNTQKKYSSISEHDRHAIIADTVSAIAAYIDSFERRKGSQFSTWAWKIYLNKVADFFRQAREWAPIDNMIASELRDHGSPRSYSFKDIVDLLKSLLKHDPECQKLLIDFCNRTMQGVSHKEMAESYGLKPNTLNQRLKRCRKKLKDLLRGNG